MTEIWPLIQFQPGPTDAELQAARDAKHALAVEEWVRADQQRAYVSGYFAAIDMVNAVHADQQRAYVSGYFAAIDMVNAVHAEILADAQREAVEDDPKRSSIGLGRKLAMLTAGERINWRARGFGAKFGEYR